MFENIEQWRLVYFFSVYFIEIPLIFITLHLDKIGKSKIEIVIIALFNWFLLLSAFCVIFGSHEVNSFVHAIKLIFLGSSSFFVGVGIYYLWNFIFSKKNKLDSK